MRWQDRAGDFQYSDFGELSARLSFSAACSILDRCEKGPALVVDRPVLRSIFKHLRRKRVEMGGLLLGRALRVPERRGVVVWISGFVPSRDFDSTGASLRMDSTIWSDARIVAGQDRAVVGWYHSHPGLGAFFSGTDRRTQKNFFNQEHSTGLVVDPLRREFKWFVGAESEEVTGRAVMIFDAASPHVIARSDAESGFGDAQEAIEQQKTKTGRGIAIIEGDHGGKPHRAFAVAGISLKLRSLWTTLWERLPFLPRP
jgi:proteasome lid subunit RPN8/RPN11